MSTVDVTSSPERNGEGEISKRSATGAWNAAQLCRALPGALYKLNPRDQFHNPVMALVWVGAVLTTILAIIEIVMGDPQTSSGTPVPGSFVWIVAGWLWLTVIFANLAESVAEGRGKAQAETLRRTRTTTVAHRVVNYDASNDPAALEAATTEVSSGDLALSDVVVVVAGQTIPGDGDVIAGIASVDESAITGESAPVVRESGGDRSAVTGGTRVLSDRIVVRITSKPGQTFVDRMIALVEGSARQKTPNEIALNILLASLSIVFVIVALALNPIASYDAGSVGTPMLVSLLVCLIPTTIGALLSAIGIAGMDRLVQHNVLAMSGRAVEAAGDVTTLLLDKTGTITHGNRRASEFVTMPGPPWPTRPRRAPPSSPWPENKDSPTVRWAGPSCPSPPRPACLVWTFPTARTSARVPPRRCSPGWRRSMASRWTPSCTPSWTLACRPSPTVVEPLWWSPYGDPADVVRSSASSISRTSSRKASPSASRSCIEWASAPSWSPVTTP